MKKVHVNNLGTTSGQLGDTGVIQRGHICLLSKKHTNPTVFKVALWGSAIPPRPAGAAGGAEARGVDGGVTETGVLVRHLI